MEVPSYYGDLSDRQAGPRSYTSSLPCPMSSPLPLSLASSRSPPLRPSSLLPPPLVLPLLLPLPLPLVPPLVWSLPLPLVLMLAWLAKNPANLRGLPLVVGTGI